MTISLTGPESSGKSTLSKWLASEYNLPLINEYAREYLREKGRNYSFDDVIKIGLEQNRRINKLKSKNITFVSDTDLLVIIVWLEDKFNTVPDEIIQSFIKAKADCYFLCYPDIQWEDDALREDPLRRIEIFDIYVKYLERFNCNYHVIKGDFTQRQDKMKEVVAESGL